MPETGAITVIPFGTPTLGDRGYLVHDGEVASLAERAGAAYLVSAEDQVSFVRVPVRDGEVVETGPRMLVTAVAAPGHAFTRLSYVLAGAAAGQRAAVFSGGSLLSGAAGRPDLTGPRHAGGLVRVRELLAGLDGYPAYCARMALAQRELVRIGIDRPAAAAAGKPADRLAGTGRELASSATATFADPRGHRRRRRAHRAQPGCARRQRRVNPHRPGARLRPRSPSFSCWPLATQPGGPRPRSPER